MERTDFEQWKAKEVARLLALVETERRYYQEMVAALPVALVVLSADRSIVSVNRAFRQTFGVRTEDLRGKSIENILPSTNLVEKIRDVHVHGIAQPALFVDLDARQFRIAIVPIRNWDEEGEIETLLMVEDLTGIERFRAGAPPVPATIPAAAPAAFLDADSPATVWNANAATLAFTWASGGAEQLLGYPVQHWLDTPRFFAERIHPEDRTATLAFYEAAIRGAASRDETSHDAVRARGGDASAEYRAVTASGGVVWCRETIRVTGRETISGVITDITQRKQLEERLLTAERTRALHGLASRLAHDLNNPLMIVTGYTEEMLHGLPPDDSRRADLQQILDATERLSGLTAQMLAFTRKQANPPQPMNVSRAVARMEEKLAHAAGERVAVEIKAEIESGGPVWALAGGEQFEEVILALVSGAREDARERSRVTVAYGTRALTERVPDATPGPGVYTVITIRDDGRGLDPDKRAAVFESFGGKDPEKTAGPALARAYALVRAWGGDIAVNSEPFHGTAFTVYLPYHEAPREASPEESQPVVEIPAEAMPQPEAPAPEPAPEILRETILVVDDEPGIRSLVRKILRREHYNVLEAGSSEEALDISATHPGRIDLLLTDVMLPGLNGRGLAERLVQARGDVQVVYVSGYTDDEAVRMGAFPPGSKFLQKPFTLGALVAKVREALDQGSGM